MDEKNAIFTSTMLQEALETTISHYTTMSPHINLTEVHGAKTQLKLYDIFIPGLGGLIIITNLMVVLSSGLLLKKGANPRTTYLFLGNVAMADLVTGLAVLFGQYYPKESRSHFSCSIQIGLIVSSTLASIYSVGLIAVDRFLYIVHGLKYHRWVYPTRARLLIIFTWAIGIILGFLPATGLWSGATEGGRICWFITLAPSGLILLITFAGLLPVILVVVLYSIILYHAVKKVVQLRKADRRDNPRDVHQSEGLRIFRGNTVNEDPSHAQQSIQRKPSHVKAVKVVAFTCGSFVLTWLPYFIASCMYVFCQQANGDCKTLKVAIASPLAILGFLNSLLNPIIYAWWHNGFRTFVRKLLCQKQDANKEFSTTTTKSSASSSRRNVSRKSSSNSNQGESNMQTVQLQIS